MPAGREREPGTSDSWLKLSSVRGAQKLFLRGQQGCVSLPAQESIRLIQLQSTVVDCPLTGREIDVESQKALRKVKHSCSEVIRALTLRFEGRSGIDRKIHA